MRPSGLLIGPNRLVFGPSGLLMGPSELLNSPKKKKKKFLNFLSLLAFPCRLDIKFIE